MANENFYSLALITGRVAASFMSSDLLRKSCKGDMREIFQVSSRLSQRCLPYGIFCPEKWQINLLNKLLKSGMT